MHLGQLTALELYFVRACSYLLSYLRLFFIFLAVSLPIEQVASKDKLCALQCTLHVSTCPRPLEGMFLMKK